MNNATFGFEHLEDRYEKYHPNHRKKVIEGDKSHDLKKLIENQYGNHTMEEIFNLNQLKDSKFLTGPEEYEYFKDNKFQQISNSTIVKTAGFATIIDRLLSNQLITKKQTSKWWKKIFSIDGLIATGLFTLIFGLLKAIINYEAIPIWEMIKVLIKGLI
jgi:hypothetical protein